MLRALAVSVLLLVPWSLVACKSSESEAPTGGLDATPGRVPLIHKDHDLYNRFEGTALANACNADSDCFKGGCSSEVCSATKDVMGTCDALAVQIPASASCGCLTGQCLWWSDGSAKLETVALETPVVNPAGVRCGDQTCADGEKCIEYFGVAGPRGPMFRSCGIPCGEGGKCPGGKRCVTIADGPGPVCQ